MASDLGLPEELFRDPAAIPPVPPLVPPADHEVLEIEQGHPEDVN